MRFIKNITTLLLVGVLLAFGINQIPVNANVAGSSGQSTQSSYAAAIGLVLNNASAFSDAGAADSADQALLHCSHCASRERATKSAMQCCTNAASGSCGECPAPQCGGCCGNGYTCLFLSNNAYSIIFPSEALPYPPEDWAAAQRAQRPLLQPPRCA